MWNLQGALQYIILLTNPDGERRHVQEQAMLCYIQMMAEQTLF
jgi:hypothetical protein